MVEISYILNTAKAIYRQVEQAKSNKEQSQRLGERVRAVEHTIRKIDVADSIRLAAPLLRLQECLQTSLNLLQQFSMCKWFYIFQASKYRRQFTQLHQRLRDCIQDLNLNLDIQVLKNHQPDTFNQQSGYIVLWGGFNANITSNQRALVVLVRTILQNVHYHVLKKKYCMLKKQKDASQLMIRKLLNVVSHSN